MTIQFASQIRKGLSGMLLLGIIMGALSSESTLVVRAEKLETEPPGSRAQITEQEYPTDRIIIKYKQSEDAFSNPEQPAQMESLSRAAGVPLQYFREMSGDAHVLQLQERLPLEQVRLIAERLMQLPEVEYAEADQIFTHTLVPNDPLYTNQWHYFEPWGINLPAAWDITTGSSSIVVAVIDTGITNHADLSGRTVPGYDFITNTTTANDGNGRDSNPSDPGDWEAANECFAGSSAQNSSWHGTHVAGTIGAAGNNGLGVAGVNWNSMILPVRVLGKCGGSLSDIADAMRWSAGLTVSGVPANPNPARVLNLSLSGSGTCTATIQNATNAITAAGSVVVVSAGNANANASGFQPANCSGVITVAATNRSGSRSYYSNYGSTVEISAPGGETNVTSSNGVLSTLNTGTTVPASDTYGYYQGTSQAAPHISGVVSLMLSRNPSLNPSEVLQILQSTAKGFPSGSSCNTSLCGSGIVDAGAAVFTAGTYLLTVNKSGTGNGTVTSNPAGINCGADCSEAYAYNTSVTLTATPATGSTFTGWSGGGCSGTGTCTVTMTADTSVTANFNLQSSPTLTISKTGTGSGIVASNPSGIDCGSTCSYAFNYNTVVTLTSTAASGSTFTGWSGGGCSGTGTCTVTMTADTSVTANFDLAPPTNIIFADGFESGDFSKWPASACVTDGGDLSVSAGAKYVGNYGMQALLDDNISIYCTSDHPNAETRYLASFYFDPNSISMVSGDTQTIFGGYTGTSTLVLRMQFRRSSSLYQVRASLINDGSTWTDSSWFTISDAPHQIKLDWRAANAAGANNGRLTLWIDGGQVADLTAVDNDTRRIDRARLGAVAAIDTGTRGTYYFDEFESSRGGGGPEPTATLTVDKTGTGSGTVTSSPTGINCGSTCSYAFNTNTVVTLTAAPTAGSTFTGWSGGGCSGSGTCTVTMTADTSVTANFALQSSPTLTISKTGSGTVTSNPAGINCGSDCSENYTSGTVVTLTATAASGSTFTGWSGGGCSGTGTCTVTLTANTSVTANFDLTSTISPWPLYGHDSAHTGYSPSNGPNSADFLWSYALGERAQDNASPVIGPDGTIYMPSEDGFFAINPNGTLKWSRWVNESTLTRNAPAVAANGTVYLTKWPEDELFALNPVDGTTLWSYAIGGTSYGSPTIGADGTIYIGNAENPSSFYALNPNGTLKWRWDSGSTCGIESSAAIGPNGDVYFQHNCLGLVSLNSSGQLNWMYSGAGDAWNSPSVGPDGTIYMADSDGYFYAFNPNGTLKWRAPVADWMYESSSAISPDGSTIYRGDNGGIFYAFNATGTVKWQYDTGIPGSITSAPALTANGIVYFTQQWSSSVQPADKGYIYALRTTDGTLLWQYEIGWSSSSPAIGVDGTLYITGDDASNNAVLYAFECADGLCAVPDPSRTLTISKTGAGSGTVTSSPAGINCGSDCSENYNSGTVVMLTATPATGSTFTGWSGDADCSDGQVTMNASRTCIANFDLVPSSENLLGNPSFEADANNDGKPDVWSTNAKFTRSTAIPALDGSYVGRFYAIDNSGATIQQVVQNLTAGNTYNFSSWVNIPATSDTFTFKIQVKWRNASNSAISTKVIKTYTTSTNGWNEATASLVAPAGTTNALVQMVVSSLNATIYVDKFVYGGSTGPSTYTLTINKTGTGSGTVTSNPAGINCGSDCSDPYTSGTAVTLTAAPAAGSTFTGWSGGGCSGTGTCTVTMTAVTSVTAEFTAASALPDLIIQSITPTPTNPQINQAVTFSVVIKNQGQADAAEFWVDLFIDTPLPGDCFGTGQVFQHVASLAAGASQTLTFDYAGFGTDGNHTVNGIVDTNCNVGESNENNNTKSINLTVGSGTDTIFADGFESCNLSMWSLSTTDGGDLSAGSPGLVGSCSMRALLDDNVVIHVTSDHPNAELRYRARFYFDPNSITMVNGDLHRIFYGYSGTSKVVLRVEFRRYSNNYQLRVGLLTDGSSWTNSGWFTITDAAHAIEFDWRAASAAGANNGGLTLWIDGAQKADLVSVDNDTWHIDRVQLGAVNGVDTGTRGTYYFDAFESRRQTYIGP